MFLKKRTFITQIVDSKTEKCIKFKTKPKCTESTESILSQQQNIFCARLTSTHCSYCLLLSRPFLFKRSLQLNYQMKYKRTECETNEHSQRIGIVQYTIHTADAVLSVALLCLAQQVGVFTVLNYHIRVPFTCIRPRKIETKVIDFRLLLLLLLFSCFFSKYCHQTHTEVPNTFTRCHIVRSLYLH